jgi:tRNA modification GTPase
METIFALATPQGKSGVAVIRISGGEAKAALRAFGVPLPAPRYATLSPLRHSATQQLIDRALILWFPAPNSFTGEDCVELHIHGSRAVMESLFSVLGGLPNMRMAEAGEFSRRAFENGKMDLTEAEGLADLIDAETKQQQHLALRQMSGELHRLYEGWREKLIDAMAFIEAYIDFPDENLPPELETNFTNKIKNLLAEMQSHLADNGRGQRLRDGAKLVILGAPNAGKSSLLNYLAKAELAIVSPTAGTTRDAISAHLNIAGYPVNLIDTAGIHTTQNPIEAEGIKRALKHADEADIRLVLIDGEMPKELLKYEDNSISVITKSDLLVTSHKPQTTISTKTGEGISELIATITEQLKNLMQPSESPMITRLRHRQCVERAADSLEILLESPSPPEIRAELLRTAAHSVASLTGRIDLEDVLDHLFSQFCIGK